MKLFLASAAAALMATSFGASAADLAKKAPVAVDYVKVCDAYGAGFFYIPGTETCLKIGGYVRTQVTGGDADGTVDRETNSFNTLGRLQLQIDARSQTAYGVLRSFAAINASADSTKTDGTDKKYDANGFVVQVDKAYIQWAGFTLGYATSMWDFFTGYAPAVSYGETVHDDTVNLAAYTFGFGNGVSATISVEDPTYAARAGGDYDAVKAPDVVANVKIEQAWGAAQLMGVAHNVYASPGAVDIDDWGFAVGAGVTIKLPMLGADDEFGLQAAYANGATRYLSLDPASAADYNAAGDLTDGWSVFAGYKHSFSPKLVGALQAGYLSFDGDEPGNTTDFNLWEATAALTWTPVTNLDLTSFVEYRSTDNKTTADVDAWLVGLRAQRNF